MGDAIQADDFADLFPEENEPDWRIRSHTEANWALERRRMYLRMARENNESTRQIVDRLRKRIDELTAKADEVNAPLLKKVEFFDAHLRAWAEAHRNEIAVGRAKSRAYPSGRIGWAKPAKGLEWKDDAALLAWAQKTDPAKFVRISFEPAKDAIKAHYEKTGVVPSGAEPKDEKDEFYVETK